MEKWESRAWSSETLCQGMASVSMQPQTLLAKTEDDSDLLNELGVPRH